MALTHLLILALATWRLANLLADTSQGGPRGVLAWLRAKLGLHYDEHSQPYAAPGSLAEGLLCIYCNSLWLGLAFSLGYLLFPAMTLAVALPLALSTLAIALNRLL